MNSQVALTLKSLWRQAVLNQAATCLYETFKIVPRPAKGQEIDAALYETTEPHKHIHINL